MLRNSEKLVRNLARAAVLGGALMPALVYMFTGYSAKQQMAADDARVQSQRVNYVIAANPEAWRYATERLIDQIVVIRHDGTHTLVIGTDGKVLAHTGEDCAGFCISGRAPLLDYGNVVGELRVDMDAAPVLIRGSLIGGMGFIIGLLLMNLLNRHVLLPLERIRVTNMELAFYDPLTRLPNRRLLMDRLQQALASNGRSRRQGAVLFIDLDNFKELNDTLGHDKGDILLQQVAQRLKRCVREGDTVARLGGDEFVVVLEELSEQAEEAVTQSEIAGEKILLALNRVYQLAAHEYHSTPSIGVTLFSDHKQSVDDLLKQADIAMYQAKTAGRNTLRFFNPEMQAKVAARSSLEKDLRCAAEDHQFVLLFQAQAYHDRQIKGVEVLLRWHHPQRGLVLPAEFIPLAEETGLILPIGQWVLESACACLETWERNLHTRHLQLAINVSASQFRQTDYVERVRLTLHRHAIKPGRLKLEITESLVHQNIADTIIRMNALKEIGVSFSMDDFGTGYSSLSYLSQLPLDQLKIDQSFVHNIGVRPNDAVIVQTIIGMSENLGVEVIAEGVETEAQRSFLELSGCRLYQGDLFSKPVKLAEFEQLLTMPDANLEIDFGGVC